LNKVLDFMTESDVRDVLMKMLFQRFGKADSWTGGGSSASFAIERQGCSGRCYVEGVLSYALPCGTSLDHKSDIQIEYRRVGETSGNLRYIGIELKHASAVTDQFKARAFDMFHLKQALGHRLHGIVVFARIGKGISMTRAKSICYSFDEFINVELLNSDIAEALNALGNLLADKVEFAIDQAG
jgi:hypothetical protein